MSKVNHWRPEEDTLLRKLWGTMKVKDIAKKMGRRPATVSERAKKLGLPPKRRTLIKIAYNLPPDLPAAVSRGRAFSKSLDASGSNRGNSYVSHWCY